MLSFQEEARDPNTPGARAGIISTSHGDFKTPLYVFAGTDAEVRTLSQNNLQKVKSIVANTYHLGIRTDKASAINKAGGIHKYMDYPGLVLTDSGGFQVFSYGISREQGTGKIAVNPSDLKTTPRQEENMVKITEDGVFFKDEKDQERFLGPKESIAIQAKIGADIMLAFDECTSPLHSYEYTASSLVKTHRWEAESLAARQSNQALFGIIQGGYFKDLREKSAQAIVNMEFDGLAIGGSFGTDRGNLSDVTGWILPALKTKPHLPRHLLGIGKPTDIFQGIANGMDTFDCVIPTREARHGSVYTNSGRLDLNRGFKPEDNRPIEANCLCPACQTYTRAELKQMLKSTDKRNTPVAELLTIHNITWFQNLMSDIRQSIIDKKFKEFHRQFLSSYN